MRGGKDHPAGPGDLWLEHRLRFARGHWRREEQAGAVRSAGWWESVTLTWSPADMPRRRSLVYRALTAAMDAITPALADLAAARARRLMDGRGTRAVRPAVRRQLPAAARALPRSRQDR